MKLTNIRNELSRIGRKNNSKKTLSKQEIAFIAEMKQHDSNPIRSQAFEIIPNKTFPRKKKSISSFMKSLGRGKHISIATAHLYV